MTQIINSSTVSNYNFFINSTSYDVLSIFGNYTSPLSSAPFITNYETMIGATSYDLSQLLVNYSSYLSSPPINTNYYAYIGGTKYDLSQIFVLYPITNTNYSISSIGGAVYYNGGTNYYMTFPQDTSNNGAFSFQFIDDLSGNLTGYLVGGGGGGAAGSTALDDSKGGAGGGGGATVTINRSVVNSNIISLSIGNGGLGAIASSTGFTTDGTSTVFKINSTTIYTADFGDGAVGAGGGGTGGSSGSFYGNGGTGGDGGPSSTLPGGGGGGGVAVNGINLSYAGLFNGTNGGNGTGLSAGTGGTYNGGNGGRSPVTNPTDGIYGGGGGGGGGIDEDGGSAAQDGKNGGDGLGVLIFTL